MQICIVIILAFGYYNAYMNIGRTLQHIRLKKHMSKNELCVKTGLNKGYMYRLENDLISPTFATLEKVAQALEEPLSKLIKEAEHAASCAVYTDVSSAESWGSAAESGMRK